MSRIGILRWNPHIDTNSTDNGTLLLDRNNYMNDEDSVHKNVFIIATLVATTLAIHAQIRQSNKAGISALFALTSFVITISLAPILCIVLLVLGFIRQVIKGLLITTCRKNTFAGLLQGNDAFWAVEEDTSKAVINILALVDFSFIVSATGHDEEPLQTLRELIMDRLLTVPAPFPKLLCYRRQFMGYFYWEKQLTIKIENHVRWMDIDNLCNGTISKSVLRGYISSLANSPLPANHLSGWEILIGQYPVSFAEMDPLDVMESGGYFNSDIRYPVMFRIHHTLGDGVALVKLFLDTLADPYSRTNTPVLDNHLLWNDQQFSNTLSKSSSMVFSSNSLSFRTMNKSAQISDVPQKVVCMKKSASYSFERCIISHLEERKQQNKFYSLHYIVHTACHRILRFIEEAGKLKDVNHKSHNLPNINITVNNRPSDEFLELIHQANNYKSNKNFNVCTTCNVSEKERNAFENLLKQECKCRDYLYKFMLNKLKIILNLIQQSSFMIFAPAVILNQILNQTCDKNLLHGPHLSGHKIVAWYLEQDNKVDCLLIDKIKQIKIKTGAHFSDIFLTALSSSLETYFSQFKEIPHVVTLVIPARIDRPDETLRSKVTKNHLNEIYETCDSKLDNKFAVAMLPLPILNKTEIKPAVFNKLSLVQQQCCLLRNSPDYYINYWMIRVVSTFLPVFILRKVIKSTQCTMVVSNMPGPPKLAKLAGHTLHDLVFWVPNKETTGVGISILSYAGRLQLGIMADRALISCHEDAQDILDGIIKSINEMYEILS